MLFLLEGGWDPPAILNDASSTRVKELCTALRKSENPRKPGEIPFAAYELLSGWAAFIDNVLPRYFDATLVE